MQSMITLFPFEKKVPQAHVFGIMSKGAHLLDHLREQGKGR
jgi:hypothetical protein